MNSNTNLSMLLLLLCSSAEGIVALSTTNVLSIVSSTSVLSSVSSTSVLSGISSTSVLSVVSGTSVLSFVSSTSVLRSVVCTIVCGTSSRTGGVLASRTTCTSIGVVRTTLACSSTGTGSSTTRGTTEPALTSITTNSELEKTSKCQHGFEADFQVNSHKPYRQRNRVEQRDPKPAGGLLQY